MTLMQLKCFYEAAKRRSITKAASELFLSQPSVSKYILQLEQELDLRLLARTNKDLLLTEEGKQIFKHCQVIFEHIDSIVEDSENMRKMLKTENVIRISCVPTIRVYGVIFLISSFMKKYPDIDIVLEEKDEDKVIYNLQASACDFAFCSDLTFVRNEFQSIKWCDENFVALFGKEFYKNTNFTNFSLNSLENVPLILNRPESMLFEHCRNACRYKGFEPTIKLVCSRPEIAAEFVTDTSACYIGLKKAVEMIQTDKHIVVPLNDIQSFDYCFYWGENAMKKPATQLLLNFIKENLY